MIFSYSSWTVAADPVLLSRLSDLVKDAVALHPLVQSAKQRLNKAKADSSASDQPLYNPELSIDYESNVEDTSTLGYSQTIDWSNKRDALSQIGRQNKEVIQTELLVIRQMVAADFVKKINQYQTAKIAFGLNSQQISALEQFVDIAQRRFKIGDISQVELDLALLVAGEIRMNSAGIQAEYFSAETELSAFVNFEKIDVPEILIQWIRLDQRPIELLLNDHPRLKQLRLATQIANSQIKLASRNKSADPTITVNAGKEGDQSIYSLGISVPLFVRNSFAAEVESAIANAAAIEQNYRNSYRDLLVAIKNSRKTLELTFAAYQNWINQSQSGLQKRGELLQRLWKSGDLSTTDYLVQLQQTLDTQISATRLKAKVINAWIEYLLVSSQIDQWLGLGKN